ncbi:MAG: CRISPR-associated protein Cas4 [Candidatus Nanohaloarchaea archaeon]
MTEFVDTREKPKVTGVMIQYYYVSKKELWYFANNVNMNYDDSNIDIGNQIQDSSFSRENTRNVLIDGTIAVDIVEGKDRIYEVKKSSTLRKPAVMQLKYYLWYLKNKKGVEMEGELKIPEEKKTEIIELTAEDEEEIEEVVEEIRDIITSDTPPDADLEKLPENASYSDFFKI